MREINADVFPGNESMSNMEGKDYQETPETRLSFKMKVLIKEGDNLEEGEITISFRPYHIAKIVKEFFLRIIVPRAGVSSPFSTMLKKLLKRRHKEQTHLLYSDFVCSYGKSDSRLMHYYEKVHPWARD